MAEPAALALLPRRPELLSRLFAVFGELETLSAFPVGRTSLPNPDEQQMRRRAFEAFCELLGRMADRNPVVISIDDLQWGDLDSIALMAQLVLPVSAPALMLILSFRGEQAATSPALVALSALRQRLMDAGSWLDIGIKGLSDDESRELLERLQADGRPIDAMQSSGIVQESGGSPLLLSELLRFSSRESDSGATPGPAKGVLISSMIRHRTATLSSTARHLLEAMSVSGEPMSKTMLCRIVDADDENPALAIGLLIREHLVLVTGGTQETRVEPFHDQVREAALSWLSPEELRGWHSRLARLLQMQADADPQRLLRHYRGAGNLPAAFDSALAAAKNSEAALAFEQAARFYTEAIETGEAGEADRASLHRRRAEVLAKAGRGYESAQSYLEAAVWPAHNDALEMRRHAAEQLMQSGHVKEGTRLLKDLLRGGHVHVPATRIESLVRMLALRLFIRVRGVRWTERSEAEIPPATLRKLDLLWSGAMALIAVDPIFGSYLQALHMLQALRAGEPFRLCLTLGIAAIYQAMAGNREYEHGLKLIGSARQLAERCNDQQLFAGVNLNRAGLDFMCGRVEDGLSHCRTGLAHLASANRPAIAWEIGTANLLLVWFLGWGGRIRELSETLPSVLADARSRGDLYAEVCAQCSATSHLVPLAADDPELAMAEIESALRPWGKKSFDLPRLNATFARVDCFLYDGRPQEARQLLLSAWQGIRKSMYPRGNQIYSVILYYSRGRTALAEWFLRPDDKQLRSETEQFSARLAKLQSPWGDALSRLLRAGVMVGLGRRSEAATLLQTAEEILREQGLRLLAAAVLRRRGELDSVNGAHRIEAADAFMRSENILRPDRMAAMILPGQWRHFPVRE